MAFLTVDIDGDSPVTRKGSPVIELRIEERSTADFVVVDTAETATYTKGQPVTIDDATGRIFGGVIDTPETVAMSPAGGLYHFIRCADWHYLADKRLIAESYLATAAGTIVADIRTKYLLDEGVTVGNIEAGPDIVEAIFNYVRASDALDALAEKSNKIWYIDENKALYFQARDLVAAPWALNDTTNRPIKGTARLSGGNPQYRNRQYIRGGRGTTLLQTEKFVADGEQNAFTLSFPCQQVPTFVEVNAVDKTPMGIKGLDAPGDFESYWNKGDPTITFTVVPTAGWVIEIRYYGQFPILVLVEDPIEIAAQLAIEGAGTGYVDDIADEPTLNNKDASIDSGEAKLARFGVAGRRFHYQTIQTGIMPGQLQTITHAALGLTAEQMLIESVIVRGFGSLITYDITAIQGPETGSWTNYFKALAAMKGEVIERLNVGTEQILIILVKSSENWGWNETITEYANACIFPAVDRYPDTIIFPC